VAFVVMLCAASLIAGLVCAALCATLSRVGTLSAEEVPRSLAMELNSGDTGACICAVSSDAVVVVRSLTSVDTAVPLGVATCPPPPFSTV
jgi:hypothetical protein